GLILRKTAGWWRWGRSSGSNSGGRFFHNRQCQDFALDGLKFRGVSLVVRRNTAELLDFLIDTLDAVLRIRVVGEKLGRILSLRLRLELLEKLRHGPRVVPRIVEDLSAHNIGLRFRGSRITQQYAAGGETAQLRQE